jgi:type I restriction enzyme, S subunit
MIKLFEQINKETYQLKDVTSLVSRGITPSYVENDGVVVLNQKCIRNWSVLFSDSRLTNKDKINSKHKMLVDGDILICSTGTGTLGRVAQIDRVTIPITVDSHISIVRPESKKVCSSFLGYILKKSEKLIESLAEGSTGQTELPRTKLEELEIELPPLDIQNSITKIISTYDAKIENNNLIIKKLEETAQILFNEWFVNFRFPGYEKVDNEMGEIPKGWKLDSVTKMFDINPQTKVVANSDVPYVEMRDLSESGMTFSYEQKRKPVAGSRFKNHDTLVARITPCLENGKTGYVDCLEDTEVAFGSTEFLVFRPKEPQFREFTYLLARSTTFRSFAIGRMIGSSGRQRVSSDDVGRYEFVKPEPAVIKEFHKVVAPMFAIIKSFYKENISLKSQRDQLLAKLI